jgi:hypothetical protein
MLEGHFVVLLTVASVLGCAHRPAVTIEQVEEIQAPSSLSQRVFPPRCEEFPVPDYPEVNMEQRPERVSVRVDFTMDEEGVPKNVRAAAINPSPLDDPYIRTSIEAVGRIRCEPAWSPPSPGSDNLGRRPREYKSSLIFHFHRDEKKAGVAF